MRTWRAVTAHQRPVAVKDLVAAISLADQLGLAMPVTRAALDVMPQFWSA